MAEEKQSVSEDMDVDIGNGNIKSIVTKPDLKQALRRTISAPSVNSGVLPENSPVFTKCSNGSTTNEIQMIENNKSPENGMRMRGYSTGSQVTPMSLNVDCNSSSPSPVAIGSPASRVLQIKREESVDELTREVAKERDIHSAIQLSRSWDEISWLGDKNYAITTDHQREKQDGIEELPSPVRFIEKFHNRSLTPSPISVPISPKQRSFRRSLSPSCLRPSILTSKRKLDPDDDSFTCSPAKRNFNSPISSSLSTCSSPDHPSDTNTFSCDDDSGNEQVFGAHSALPATLVASTPLSCDTRTMNSFPFVKPRYVAPQSPLAAGVTSASIAHDVARKPTIGCASYTFQPLVKE